MAYNAVPTAVTGDLWTAADFNSYFRDNFAAGVPDLFTSKGDLTVGTGPNAAIRLGVGSGGTILTANPAESSGMEWVETINAGAKVSAADFTVNAYEAKTVNFTSELLDTHGFVNLATYAQRITIPAGFGGWYKIVHYTKWNNEYHLKWIWIRKNGVDLLHGRQIPEIGNSRAASCFTYLADGDYLTMTLHHYFSSLMTIAGAELSIIRMQV